MSGDAKVLTGFLERRALEEAFAELAHVTDPAVAQQQAQAIATHGAAALQHLVSLLDTTDPQLRGGLGLVARYLPRDQAVPALRAVARAQDRTDQARLAALTVLERFLGEPVDDALLAGLRNPQAAARQSLSELIAAMDEEPLSVIEYLEQLSAQPPEVASMVLDALPAVEASPHLATLLRLLAQGDESASGLAHRAIEELVKLRTPAALRALASLTPNLPPDLAALAERGARKLRFSGVSDSADHDPQREPWYAPSLHWRLLLSPVDVSAGQFLLFIGQEDTGSRAVIFTVLVQTPGGIRDASGALDANADHVPPRRRTGALHLVVGDGDEAAPAVTLLEAPLDLGFTTLREALVLNWSEGTPAPVGYRLFSPLIWLSHAAAEAKASLTPPVDLTLAQAELDAILDHPAFYGWFWEMDGEALAPEATAAYSQRFVAMSRWLAAAGDNKTARTAATVAYHLDEMSSEARSFLAAAWRNRQDLKDQSKENHNV